MGKNATPCTVLFFVLSILLASLPLAAQQGNPFELKHRQQTAAAADSSSTSDNPFAISRPDTVAAVVPEAATAAAPELEESNPFEVKTPASSSGISDEGNPFDIKRPKPAVAEQPQESKEEGAEVAEPVSGESSGSFLFWVILAMLIILTLSVSMYRSFIIRSYRAFTNENFLKLIHRDQGSIVKAPYLILYVSFFFNTAIFFYLIFNYFGAIKQGSFGLLFQLFGIVCALFLIKHIVLKIIGNTFPVNKELKLYSFTIVIFSIIIGLLLAPLNTLIAFAPAGMTPYLVFGALFIVALVYLFRTFRSLFIASRFITFQKFHFFMYLCAVEIAPLLIIIKVITLKTGIQ